MGKIRMHTTSRMIAKLAGLAALLLPMQAHAAWPERTTTIIVPFAAGGITDVLARLTAERLERRLKQTFIVENVVGAAGILAATRAARADPDGYTLFFATVSQLTIAPFTHKISYDPIKDFRPVSVVATSPFVITVGEQVPARTLPEFVTYAKSKPGLTFGSAGAGSLTHLAAALFTKSAGITMSHVPYRGIAPAFQDLVAGHVVMMSPSPVELRPMLDKGGLKPLAVTDTKRTKVLPNVPAITEHMKVEPVVTWNGIVVPAKTPDAVVDTLSKEIRAATQDSAFIQRLDKIGVDPVVHTPQDFARLIAQDTARWRQTIADLGLTVSK
jgi:tripartite-type tricarboxylate transporter receptor subunit TctC